MSRMWTFKQIRLSRLLQRYRYVSRGVSLVEYALLGVLITVACYTAMHALGGEISRIVIDSCDKISNAVGSA